MQQEDIWGQTFRRTAFPEHHNIGVSTGVLQNTSGAYETYGAISGDVVSSDGTGITAHRHRLTSSEMRSLARTLTEAADRIDNELQPIVDGIQKAA